MHVVSLQHFPSHVEQSPFLTPLVHFVAAASLDLPKNDLSGSIPSEVGLMTRLGELVCTIAIRLKRNALRTLSYFVFHSFILDWLSLSNNELTGSIPSEINAMVNLSE